MDIRPDAPDRSAPSVLLVEDDERFRERLGRALTARGCEVRAVASVDEAMAAARSESPELAVVDLKLPVGSGLDVVRGLHAIDPTTRIVVLTGYGSIATALESVKLGATHYLTKPVDADQVLAAFEGRDVTQEPPTVGVPSLARVEWEHIQRVLNDCDGNVSQAARLLGIHRRSLQRKLSKFPTAR
ncbi:MAG: response regulator [Acidobacteriota bacterium]|nr:response regulator [Acidobacteriota bacterium]